MVVGVATRLSSVDGLNGGGVGVIATVETEKIELAAP